MTNTKSSLKGVLILLTTAIIWGSSFIAQEVGGGIGAFTFMGSRSLVGAVTLLPVILVSDFIKRRRGGADSSENSGGVNPTLLLGGALCGFMMFVATNLQQFGMNLGTNSGKAGFITTLYIIIVPIIGLFIGKKASKIIWACAAVSVAGLFLLCNLDDMSSFCVGDALVFLCAIAFAGHISIVDHFAPRVDCLKMSCIQLLVCSVLSMAAAFIFESPDISEILDNFFPIFYSGFMSSGIAYTLQMVGQRYTRPTLASMIMSLESVFAMISNIVFPLISASMAPYFPSGREIFGCVLIFAAIIVAQLKDTGVPAEQNA